MAPVPYSRMHLLERPDVRPSPRPYIHGTCQSELNKLYPTTYQQTILKAQIKKRMDFYQDHRTDFVDGYPLFEFYGNYNDQGTPLPVYVMRFNKLKPLGNLRIFFVVYNNEMCLIHAFQEKGKNTYGPAYEVVKKRLS